MTIWPAALCVANANAYATVITSASIAKQDGAVELRFDTRGRGLRWRLSAHRQDLWIDLDHVRLDLPEHPLPGPAIAPVKSVHVIDGGAGTARLDIEVRGRADYVIGQLPHELILRLAPTGTVADLAAPLLIEMERPRSPPRASPPATPPDRPGGPGSANLSAGVAAARSPAQVLSDNSVAMVRPPPLIGSHQPSHSARPPGPLHPIVVIDAGHGGYDPGTEAAGAVAEKDLALQIARQLRDALTASGIDARMTRDDDVFLALAERTRLANDSKADLFVSIHLNSSPDSNTAGIETYYLNNTTDRATMRLARMENGVAGGYGAPGQPNLNYILTDMRQQYKANESASLARMIEAETVADIYASTGFRVKELGAKQGPFYVLVGALMPSVLVECGFLSNPAEARVLQSAQYQQALAEGIARAVAHYFNADAAVGNL